MFSFIIEFATQVHSLYKFWWWWWLYLSTLPDIQSRGRFRLHFWNLVQSGWIRYGAVGDHYCDLPSPQTRAPRQIFIVFTGLATLFGVLMLISSGWELQCSRLYIGYPWKTSKNQILIDFCNKLHPVVFFTPLLLFKWGYQPIWLRVDHCIIRLHCWYGGNVFESHFHCINDCHKFLYCGTWVLLKLALSREFVKPPKFQSKPENWVWNLCWSIFAPKQSSRPSPAPLIDPQVSFLPFQRVSNFAHFCPFLKKFDSQFWQKISQSRFWWI